MRNLFRIFVLLMLGFASVLTSCKKERSEDTVTPAGPTDYATTTVVGMVFDQNHNVLSGVDITVGDKTFTTNYDGSFMFSNVTVNKNRFMAKFNKTNYFETVKTEKTVSGGITRLDVAMIDKSYSSSTSFSPTTGADLDMYADGKLHFPANLSYVDANGNPYTGNITVNAKFLDASSEDYSRFAPGGDQFGVLTTAGKSTQGDNVYLMSIGGMLIELTDGSGGLLNLASDNDSLVTVETPIPAIFAAMAPDSIDNWYTGGNLAYSSNEGSGRKEGGKYISEVGHFSYWSVQIPYTGSATINGTVTDASGNIVSGVRVNVGQSYAVTDNDGHYSRIVAAGIPGFLIQVLPTDYNNYSSNQVTQPSLGDGATVTVDLVIAIPAGDMIAVTGTLINCNSTPTAGKVFISYGSYVTQTFTQDGSFSLLVPTIATSITLKCQVGESTKDIYLNLSGVDYDAGNIQLCPPPTGSNEITIDGTVYGDFTQSLAHIYTSYNQLYIDASGDNRSFYFYMDNFTGPGTYPITISKDLKTNGSIDIDGSYYSPESGNIIVTQYGAVGGRVVGTFSITASGGETITGKFNSLREADQAKK